METAQTLGYGPGSDLSPSPRKATWPITMIVLVILAWMSLAIVAHVGGYPLIVGLSDDPGTPNRVIGVWAGLTICIPTILMIIVAALLFLRYPWTRVSYTVVVLLCVLRYLEEMGEAWVLGITPQIIVVIPMVLLALTGIAVWLPWCHPYFIPAGIDRPWPWPMTLAIMAIWFAVGVDRYPGGLIIGNAAVTNNGHNPPSAIVLDWVPSMLVAAATIVLLVLRRPWTRIVCTAILALFVVRTVRYYWHSFEVWHSTPWNEPVILGTSGFRFWNNLVTCFLFCASIIFLWLPSKRHSSPTSVGPYLCSGNPGFNVPN